MTALYAAAVAGGVLVVVILTATAARVLADAVAGITRWLVTR